MTRELGRYIKPTPILDEIEALLKLPNSPPVETAFRMVKAQGYRICNLCHRMDGMWQANLRSRDNVCYFEFAYAGNAFTAVLGALKKAITGHTAKVAPPHPDEMSPLQVGSIAEPTAPIPSDDDLLGVPDSPAAQEVEEDLLG